MVFPFFFLDQGAAKAARRGGWRRTKVPGASWSMRGPTGARRALRRGAVGLFAKRPGEKPSGSAAAGRGCVFVGATGRGRFLSARQEGQGGKENGRSCRHSGEEAGKKRYRPDPIPFPAFCCKKADLPFSTADPPFPGAAHRCRPLLWILLPDISDHPSSCGRQRSQLHLPWQSLPPKSRLRSKIRIRPNYRQPSCRPAGSHFRRWQPLSFRRYVRG